MPLISGGDIARRKGTPLCGGAEGDPRKGIWAMIGGSLVQRQSLIYLLRRRHSDRAVILPCLTCFNPLIAFLAFWSVVADRS